MFTSFTVAVIGSLKAVKVTPDVLVRDKFLVKSATLTVTSSIVVFD
jgi:hypothetical protein